MIFFPYIIIYDKGEYMEHYWIILFLPIIWYLISISYQILNLFYLWLKYKFENTKVKEYQLWD